MDEWDLFWRWWRRYRREIIAWIWIYILMLLLAVCMLAKLALAILASCSPTLAPKPVPVTPRTEIREMVVTAYTCGPESTGKGPGHPEYRISRSGYKIRPHDRVVAAPPEIPFGAHVVVPGYGEAPVVDRGGAIQGDHLDVHIEDVSGALAWGRQRLQVTIIYP